jgi:hypothetical protein
MQPHTNDGTGRKNQFLQKKCLFSTVAFAAITFLLLATSIFTGCGGFSSLNGEYTIVKISDWEKLNLKNVEEYIEQKVNSSYKEARDYTRFNEQGYIVEQGRLDYDRYTYKKDYKEVRELREYDAKNNLLKKKYGSRNLADTSKSYSEDIYDLLGRQTEYRRNGKTETVYRYENAGKRTEKVFENNKLSHKVTYDKYRNELSYIKYNDEGTEELLRETEYTYDKNGKILTQIFYHSVELPLSKDFKKEYRTSYKYVFTYDENNHLTSIQKFQTEAYHDMENKKIEMQETPLDTIRFTYDMYGNDTKNGKVMFECDGWGNWILKYENRKMTRERFYKYFGKVQQGYDDDIYD